MSEAAPCDRIEYKILLLVMSCRESCMSFLTFVNDKINSINFVGIVGASSINSKNIFLKQKF